jgi:hypothetical protein
MRLAERAQSHATLFHVHAPAILPRSCSGSFIH